MRNILLSTIHCFISTKRIFSKLLQHFLFNLPIFILLPAPYPKLAAGCVVCILYLQHSDPDEEKLWDLETLETEIM